MTATLPRERLLGIALEGSSPTAHAAILARAYGIPAIVGASDLIATLRTEGESGRATELAIDGNTALLTVRDDGPGLPAGMEDQVFARFVRGEGPADRSARNGVGTGLGLSIVRAVATAHGGTVSAVNGPDGGACFEVRMPLAAATGDSESVIQV